MALNIPEHLRLYAPVPNFGDPRNDRCEWQFFSYFCGYPLPAPGWLLSIYRGIFAGDGQPYVAASIAPSGTVCRYEWVSEAYDLDGCLADYKTDDRLPGVRLWSDEPELKIVDESWTGEMVEAYGDYLATFGIDCAYPEDEAYRDRFISCCYDDDFSEDAEGTVEAINLVIRDWINLIKEACV